jgi:hypothetical protein
MDVLAHTDDAVIEFIDAWAHDWANDQWRALTASEQLDVGRRIMDAATTKLRGAVEEIERLRGINSELVQAHNALLQAVVKSETDADALRSHFGGQ